MTPVKILVTGATGFIGSRLCELLSLEHRLPYRALVRNYSRAARIARLDAELVAGDMLDADSLARAVKGCDAVVNLAHSDDKTAAKQTALLSRGVRSREGSGVLSTSARWRCTGRRRGRRS